MRKAPVDIVDIQHCWPQGCFGKKFDQHTIESTSVRCQVQFHDCTAMAMASVNARSAQHQATIFSHATPAVGSETLGAIMRDPSSPSRVDTRSEAGSPRG